MPGMLGQQIGHRGVKRGGGTPSDVCAALLGGSLVPDTEEIMRQAAYPLLPPAVPAGVHGSGTIP